jgi:putative phosphoribosyl transferase
MIGPVYGDRREAGQVLAERLADYAGRSDVVVLGLARGGVPVAAPVAAALGAPLDVFVVRKLGLPEQPELAMGAVASGGATVRNPEVLARAAVPEEVFERVRSQELAALAAAETRCRGDRPPVELTGRTVVVVDDGLATGASMRAAVKALRPRCAAVTVAVPVGARSSCTALGDLADEVVCVRTPIAFYAVGAYYRNFEPVTDEEVRRLLARSPPPGPDGTAPPATDPG